MKKIAFFVLFVSILTFVSCGRVDSTTIRKTQGKEEQNDEQKFQTEDTEENNKYQGNVEETVQVDETISLMQYDLFNAVSVSYSGRAPFGTAEMHISEDLPFELKNNVEFNLSNVENLSNGDHINLNITYDPYVITKAGYEIIGDTSIQLTVYGLDECIEVDAFDGLQVDFFGVSPFCTAVINNANCSKEAQTYVTYSFAEQNYANGDIITVTAEISEEITKDYGYIINSEKAEKEFVVSNVPYYITKLDDMDVESITSELHDYVLSESSFETKYNVFGQNAWNFLNKYGNGGNNWCTFSDVMSVVSKSSYLLTIKETSKEKVKSEGKPYNSLRIFATCEAHARHQNGGWDADGTIYICFNLNNVVAYPDGRIGWGDESPEVMNISYNSTLNGLDSIVETNVTVNSKDYNISLLQKEDWLNISN